ncbi:MAG: hypothetical protein PUP92_26530 [Rhizonema sp. PD38]|nr:hypothetical protein [Rhizonema sp. PD38]
MSVLKQDIVLGFHPPLCGK